MAIVSVHVAHLGKRSLRGATLYQPLQFVFVGEH